MESQEKALVFDIQAHSVHDGPGTRTLIFFSGCPLRCAWCANPEGLQFRPQLMFKSGKCQSCPRRCIGACPRGAVHPLQQGGGALVRIEHSLCTGCDSRECLEVCYTGALQLSGRWYSVDELMNIVQRDRDYWGPQGGISLSGGEPLTQIAFVSQFLGRCHDSCVSACVETCGHVPRENFEAILPFVQWLFFDLKHMDSACHRSGTGVGNETILRNLQWIAGSDWRGRILLRMPVIPGFNDSIENARATAAFMKSCGLHEMNLLPFHRLGASKYEQLDLEYKFKSVPAMPLHDLSPLAKIYTEMGINCYIGSETPF